MTIVVKHIIESVTNVLSDFFSSDMGVISGDAKKLMADKDNRDIYLNGIKELREKENAGDKNPTVTITLKNQEKLTLSR